MTVEGVDYAWSRPSPAGLYAAGKRFAVRYVSYSTAGKNLTRAEAEALGAAGLAVVTNWEWDARDQLGGYAAGRTHAAEAARQHVACGGWPGRPIYFSTDFDASSAELSGPVAGYFRGVAEVLGIARVGVYGGLRTVQYLLNHGLARWAWQTYAWSGGVWDARAQLRQYRNGIALAGGTVDLDRSTTGDFGQWTVDGEDDVLTPDQDQMLRNVHTWMIEFLRGQTDPSAIHAVPYVPNQQLAKLVERPPVQAAPIDPATLKVAMLDPEVLTAIGRAVLDEQHRRDAE